MRWWLEVLGCVAIVVGVLVGPGATGARAMPDESRARAQLARLQVPFVANLGQTDAQVSFYAPSFAGTLFVTRRGDLVYSLPAVTGGARPGARNGSRHPGWTLTESLRGGRARPVGQDPSATGVTYFLGSDPTRWHANAPAYDQLSLGEVWPGIAVSLRARGSSAEKIFTVSPGAPVARIRVRVNGARGLAVQSDGTLTARTGLGPVTFTAPSAYQDRDGARRPVTVAYRLVGREYGFTAGAHDPALPLVIDPLVQATYLDSSGSNGASDLLIHPTTGDVYVAGSTLSASFPGTAGGAQPATGGVNDAFVARLNGALTSLIQATYLGGGGGDFANALAIHPTTGEIYVAGSTTSTNFPHTGGGAQPAYGGASIARFPIGDAFVARLNGALTTLTQATYLGGSGDDAAWALAIHPTTGDVYVAGYTFATNFPQTGGGAQPASGSGQDAFVARLNGALTTLTQATYLGGSGDDGANALAIHPATGDVYVAGLSGSTNFPGTAGGAQPTIDGSQDGFAARLNGALTSLTQATYLGGSGTDAANALAIRQATGDVYVAGVTGSTDFPHTGGGAQPTSGGGAADAFVARLNGALTAIIQATYLGGAKTDTASALVLHAAAGDDVYVAGITSSTNFPQTAGGAQPTPGSTQDAFVARLNSALTALIQATYLGGNDFEAGNALAVHPTTGDIYVAGTTGSTNFPGTAGGAQPTSVGPSNTFLARLTFGLALADPALTLSASVNQATFTVGQSLSAGGAVVDPGLPVAADFYVGLARPDGSIQFFTDAGIVLGHVASVASFRPLAVAVSLGVPFSVSAPSFYTHQWTAGDPHGDYVFFVAAVKTGALSGGTIPGDQILGLATAPFSF